MTNKIHFYFLWCLFCYASSPPVLANTIHITDAWVNEAPPGVLVNAGYFVIENQSSEPVTLHHVNSPDYARIEIHRTSLNDSAARMLPVDIVDIPANGTVKFEPGNYHLMLFNGKKYFQPGDTISLTFEFAGGITIPVTAEIRRFTGGHSHQH